jgi:predicted nucleic acid-binding protein
MLLNASHVTTVRVSQVIAEEAARLRANYSLRTPDAIQLATAVRSGASSFLTNDSKLPSLTSLNVLILNRLIAITP